MFKKAIFVVLETLLFLLAYGAGIALQLTGKLPMWSTSYHGGKSLIIWDAIIIVVAVFLLVLLVQLLRRTIARNWGIPVLALILSLLLLASVKFPFVGFTPSGPPAM